MSRALNEIVNRLDLYSASAIKYSKTASISIYDAALQYQPSVKLYTKMAGWYLGFVFWIVLWIPVGFVLTLLTVASQDKRQYYNCSSWALRQWVEHGGYMVFRWNRCSRIKWIKWPHFLWISQENHASLTHYVPYKKDEFLRVIPRICFNGYVKSGDHPAASEES